MGLNLDTGNYGFITNYENKPIRKIHNLKYKRANLLLNFLKDQRRLEREEQFRRYLGPFLKEGHLWNGTNIWLSNLPAIEEVYFAHNQSSENNFIVLDED